MGRISTEELLNKLIDRIKHISNKEVEYGYIDNYNFDNYLLGEGRLILNIESVKTESKSLSHLKNKEREINMYYINFNDLTNISMDEVIEIENILDKLVIDEEIKDVILNMEYEYSVRLDKIQENDITGVIIIEIKLIIKER